MRFRLFVAITLLSLSSTLYAESQDPARYQIYGGYIFLSNTVNGVPGSHQPLNGWDGSVAFFSWHGLRLKADASGFSATNLGAPQRLLYVMGGGQYSRRIGRETVFAEGLMGDVSANKNWGANGSPGSTASFCGFVGGGLDSPLARHISLRVDGGLQYSNFALYTQWNVPYRIPGLPTNFGRISSGLVWQF